MLKRLLSIFLVIVMLLSFASCTKKGKGTTTTEPTGVTTPEATTPEATTPEQTTPEQTTPEQTTPEQTTPDVTDPVHTHTEVTDKGKAATCTEDGLTDGKHCSTCNEVLLEQVKIPATGHSWGDWKETKAPTENNSGEEARECSVCKAKETRTVASLGHICKNHIKSIAAKAATCTADGNKAYYECDGCYKAYSDANAASEIKDKSTLVIKATGHTAVTVKGKEATCTADGLTDGSKCSKCSAVLKAQEKISASGHSYGDWKTTKEPTTAEEGIKERTCSSCNDTQTESIPKKEGAVKVGDVFDFASDFGKPEITDFFRVHAKNINTKQYYTDFTYHDGSDESIKSATHAKPMIGYRVDGVNNAVFYSKSDENHILKWYPQSNTETRVVFTAPADGTYSYEMGAHGIWSFDHSSTRYYAEANGKVIHDAKYPKGTPAANSMTSFKGSVVLLKGQTLVFVYDPEDSYAGDNSFFDAFRVTYTSTDTTGAVVTPPADENKNEWSLKADLSSATQGQFSFVYAIDRPQTVSSPFTPQVKDGKLVTIIGNDADSTKDGEPVFYIENGVIHANLAYYGREDQLSFGITFLAPEDGEYTFTVKWIRDSAGTNWNQRFVLAGDSWVVNNVAMGTALNVDTFVVTLKKNQKIHISSTCGGADTGKAVIEIREFTVKLNEKVDFTPEDQNNPVVNFTYTDELAPIWQGNTVYDEVIMLVGKNDAAPLLYPATEIVSITNFTGTKTFVEGKDYVYENGMIKMPAGSSLTYCPETTYWKKHNYDVYTYNDKGELAMTMAGPGNTLPQYQLKVTYKHNATSTISVPDKSETFKDVIAKLEKGEDVTIIFFGDSITEGWDNTLKSNLNPYMPPWSALVVQYLADKYDYAINYVDQDRSVVTGAWNYPTNYRVSFGDRGTIYYINTAVGGYTAQTALDKFGTHVSQQIDRYGCDLMFYAFGMNTGGQNAQGFANLAKTFAEKVFAKAPDVKLVMVSSMLPNTEGKNDGVVQYQEEALKPIIKSLQDAGHAVELAPLQSVHKVLDSVKRFRETSGNNMNHPGDYLHRVYAMVALETICGYSNDYK